MWFEGIGKTGDRGRSRTGWASFAGGAPFPTVPRSLAKKVLVEATGLEPATTAFAEPRCDLPPPLALQ
jgi:hypothetical protein